MNACRQVPVYLPPEGSITLHKKDISHCDNPGDQTQGGSNFIIISSFITHVRMSGKKYTQ